MGIARVLRSLGAIALVTVSMSGCVLSSGPLGDAGEPLRACGPAERGHDYAWLNAIIFNDSDEQIVLGSVALDQPDGLRLREAFVGPLPPEGAVGEWPDIEPVPWLSRTPISGAMIEPGAWLGLVLRITVYEDTGSFDGIVVNYRHAGRMYVDVLPQRVTYMADCAAWEPRS